MSSRATHSHEGQPKAVNRGLNVLLIELFSWRMGDVRPQSRLEIKVLEI